MRKFVGSFASLLLLAAGGLAAAPAQAQDKCFAPSWHRVTDPRLGVSAEFTAETWMGYGEAGGFLTYSLHERAGHGGEVPGRCSDFNVAMNDLRDNQIGDPEGLFDSEQQRHLKGLRDVKLVSSRRLTFGGYPAREFSYRFIIDFFFTPATHRVMLVARGNRLYEFDSSWGDAGPTPPDSQRAFDSIRFVPFTTDPHMASRGLLSMTINEYWRYDPYPSRVFFTPELKKIADSKRAAESAVVKGYGYFEEPQFLRMENGYRVFRIEHEHAIVDWYIRDDGRQISGLTWKVVSKR